MSFKKKFLFIITFIAFTSVCFTFQNNKLEESKKRGKTLYQANCTACHLENGEGIPSVFPPLAKSDYLMADTKRAILQILNGASGEMKVNGQIYNGTMSGFSLSDEEVSDVLNYIMNSWGNEGGYVSPEEVKKARK